MRKNLLACGFQYRYSQKKKKKKKKKEEEEAAVTHLESQRDKSAVSLLQSGEQRCVKAISNKNMICGADLQGVFNL